MRKVLAFLLVIGLAAALPAVAQPPADGAPCAALPASVGADCCDSELPSGCEANDCVGAGAALAIASPDRGHAWTASDSPGTQVARPLAPPARAPDTAPPKPVA